MKNMGNGYQRLKTTKLSTVCIICHKTNGLSNTGVGALKIHHKGPTHVENMKKRKRFFGTLNNKQTKITESISNSEIAKAEIRWILKSVTSGYSNNSNANTSSPFSVMFPDSEIAKKYQLGADKMRYSVNSGIGPHFMQILMNNVQKSRFYVLSFDESLNQSTQTSELDLLVRYSDIPDRRVYTRYISPLFRHTR